MCLRDVRLPACSMVASMTPLGPITAHGTDLTDHMPADFASDPARGRPGIRDALTCFVLFRPSSKRTRTGRHGADTSWRSCHCSTYILIT